VTRYYITDRKHASGAEPLIAFIAQNLAAGADMIQIREKDLNARELAAFARRVLSLPNPRGVPVLVNDRADVALACGAAGVHLPSNALPPSELRRIAPAEWLIGVSCHSVEEVRRAEQEAATFVVFGAVFAPLSKTSAGEPCGLHGLERAARAVAIPVYALGGITEANAADCISAGAAGIAGITLFQQHSYTGRQS
jgi:thiamine-phosphate pyrophosphorylase